MFDGLPIENACDLEAFASSTADNRPGRSEAIDGGKLE
jgi:hypothetical protein